VPLSCARQFCSKPAHHRPVLVLRTTVELDGSVAVRMIVPLPVCPRCVPDIGVKELVSDGAWLAIEDLFRERGRAVPDRSLTTVEWEPWA
jgi:hypothetical protein